MNEKERLDKLSLVFALTSLTLFLPITAIYDRLERRNLEKTLRCQYPIVFSQNKTTNWSKE